MVEMYPVILLLGGFGSRLKSISNGIPKALMKVGNGVFLDILIKNICSYNVNHIYLSTFYKSELFDEYINNSTYRDNLSIIREPEPLGTGGAVKYLLENSPISSPFFVINGDSISKINLIEFAKHFNKSKYNGMIGLSSLNDTRRFGRVNSLDGKIVSFHEKLNKGPGWINNGNYLFKKELFSIPNKLFSLENDLFPILINSEALGIFKVYNDNFIDIGVPDDYFKLCSRYKSEL